MPQWTGLGQRLFQKKTVLVKLGKHFIKEFHFKAKHIYIIFCIPLTWNSITDIAIIISQLAISETNGSSAQLARAAPSCAVQSKIMRKKLAHLGPPGAKKKLQLWSRTADHNCLWAIFCSLIHELELELKSEKKNRRLLQLMKSLTSQWF